MDLTDEEVTVLLLLARLLQAGPVDPGQESMNGGCGQRQRGWLPRGDTVELLNPSGDVVDGGTYESAPEGVQVQITRAP